MEASDIGLEIRDTLAIVTLNRPRKLNALTRNHYSRLGSLLSEIAERKDITTTLLTGTGRFFSAGADISPDSVFVRQEHVAHDVFLKEFMANNIFITHAFYSHPKVLIAALNGPVVGLSAALIAHSDFIYCMPHTYLLTPFTSLGLVAEGGSSFTLAQRLGLSKANEALLMSKKISAEELLQVGFVNRIIDTSNDANQFLKEVLIEIDSRLGSHLNAESILKTKALIRAPAQQHLDRQGLHEAIVGVSRFAAGIPQEEFRRLASGEKRHKL